jgi:hypothetical protein
MGGEDTGARAGSAVPRDGIEPPTRGFSIGGGVQDRTENAPISRGAGSHLGAVDPDEALRVALKAAVDAGQWERVRVLTELLASALKGAEVVELATRRKSGPS